MRLQLRTADVVTSLRLGYLLGASCVVRRQVLGGRMLGHRVWVVCHSGTSVVVRWECRGVVWVLRHP